MKSNPTRAELMEQTRQKIIHVATDLFMRDGYQATSTREIAKICGITQPALYHHFADKEAIYREVITVLTGDVKIVLNEILAKTVDLETMLYQMIVILIEKHPTNVFLMIRDILNEMQEHNKAQMFDLWQNTYLASFETFVEKAKQEGIMESSANNREAARYILSAISPLLQIRSRYQPAIDLDTIIKRTIHYILYGILR